MHADVLLVTATEVESTAVLGTFKGDAKAKKIDGRHYWDLGSVNGAHVFLTQSEMGAGSLGATQQTVQAGIGALTPQAVISVGIAFGKNKRKQTIGEILITTHLSLYEPQRIGKKIVQRGAKPPSSPELLNRFRNAHLQWSGAKVHFGVVLTGEKLVDNIKFMRVLQKVEPEAIGGEMEGAGLHTACDIKKVDWILVKAICDWADGNKGRNKVARQKEAAKNAAEFVLHALRFTPFKGSHEERRIPSTLPSQPFFFGREKELADIADAIAPESRTWGVLVDGPGGIGKTALAIRAGHVASTEQFERKIFLSAKKRDLMPAGEQPREDFVLTNYFDLLSELAREVGEENLEREPESKRASSVRLALLNKKALIVIDNLETLDGGEQERLYYFLGRLPEGCKAIVTSRRRTDIDARIIRLGRMEKKDALDLIAELAKQNRLLAKASEREQEMLYEVTGGNPLVLRWTAGQLGRGRCRTVAEACEYLRNAPPDNDPLEYIFGDLLGEFTSSETAVLAALAHFSQFVSVEWVVAMTGLSTREVQTVSEDLTSRALLADNGDLTRFYLQPLAATFLKRKRPADVAQAGDRLADRAYSLIKENGGRRYDRFPTLEVEWPAIEAALPRLIEGENGRLQKVCGALANFFYFSGRWDEELRLELQAEKKAEAANDPDNAGYRALWAGHAYDRRRDAASMLICAERAETHWKAARMVPKLRSVLTVRGRAYLREGKLVDAAEMFREGLLLSRAAEDGTRDVSIFLEDLARVEWELGQQDTAERYLREAVEIAEAIKDAQCIAAYSAHLAKVVFKLGRSKEAENLASEALQVATRVGRQDVIGLSCLWLAAALAQQGRQSEGLILAQRAVEIFFRLREWGNLSIAKKILKECE